MRLKTLVDILATFDPEMPAILVCSGSSVIVFQMEENGTFGFVKMISIDDDEGITNQPLPKE